MKIYTPKHILLTGLLLLVSLFARGQCPGSISIDASTREMCIYTVGIYVTFSGGYNYQWYKNGQPIPGATSSFMNLNGGLGQGGSYFLLADVSGCRLKSNTINIVDYTPTGVNVYPNGNNNICKGGNIELIATYVPGYSYQWMRGNSDIGGATSNVYVASEAGNYKCRVTPSRFCPVEFGNIPVKVIDPKIIPSSSLELCSPGQPVTLNVVTDEIDPSYFYQWRKDGYDINGATGTSYTTTQSGSYTVALTYRSNNNCVATSDPVNVIRVTGGSTHSTISGSTYHTTCTQDFGTTTLTGHSGTIVRWEYSGYSSEGPWTNWGQGGQTTTTSNCCLSEGNTLWVRAVVRNANCPDVGSTPTAYYRQLVTINAWNDGPKCPSDPAPLVTLSATSIPGATYYWTGPNSFIRNTTENPIVINGLQGPFDYTVYAIVNGCTTNSATTRVIVWPYTPTPIIQPFPPVCDGGTLNLTASHIPGATYQWTGPNGFTSNLQNPTISPVSAANAGPYFVKAIANGCSSGSSMTNVIIHPNPVAGSISGTQGICSGNSPSRLNGTPGSGGSYQWQSSPDNSSWSDIPGATLQDYQPGPLTATTYFKRCIVSQYCGKACTGSVMVTVTLPLIANAGPDQLSSCGLTNATLAGNNPGSSTGLWTIINGTGGVIANPSSYNSQFSGTLGNTYTLRWTITNGPCTGSDHVEIKFNPIPTVNAGPDQTLCGVTNTVLQGSNPTAGTGLWAIVSGSGGAINNPTAYNPQFTGIIGNAYTLRWTITNGPCNNSDYIDIKFNAMPAVNAGPDQNACDSITTLIGNIPQMGIGSWSQISGPSPTNFVNAASPISLVSVALSGTYIYRWTISSPGCPLSTDDVQVIYTIVPPATFTYGSETYCNWFSGLYAPANPKPTITGKSVAGKFTANSANIKFININTGEVDLKNSAGGSYIVTNTVSGSAGCPASVATANLTLQAPTTFTVKQDADPTNPGKVYYYIEEALNDEGWRNQYTFEWILINSRNRKVEPPVYDEDDPWHTSSYNFAGFLLPNPSPTLGTLIVDVTSIATGCKTRKVFGVQGREVNY